MILDLLPVGLLIHQPQGILFANQAACSFLDQSQDALVGQHFLDYLTDLQAAELSALLQRAFETRDVIKKDKIHLKIAQHPARVLALTIAKLPWEGTPVVQVLMQDITQQVDRERQMQNMMATDALTGAHNRRSFIKYVDELKAMPHIGSCGVLLWDIDYFKNVNDTYGHQGGDVALMSLVLECEHVLAQRTLVERPNLPRAMLARFGGEEFAVLIPCSDIDETLAYAERIRVAIAEHTVHTHNHKFSVTVSLGVVMGDLAVDNIDLLLGLADKALYAAKENGRNQIVCAQASMPLPPDGRRISRDTGRSPGEGKLH